MQKNDRECIIIVTDSRFPNHKPYCYFSRVSTAVEYLNNFLGVQKEPEKVYVPNYKPVNEAIKEKGEYIRLREDQHSVHFSLIFLWEKE